MRLSGFLLLAALLLTLLAYQRPAEYDEAYSIFLTAGHARPPWPQGVFTPAEVAGFYAGHASLGQIAQDLKTGDVHPPLYFWVLEFWRRVFGPGWFTARLLSVVFSLGSLGMIAWRADAAEIPVFPALGIALLSYGFAYTGIIARGFALAQFLNLAGAGLLFHACRKKRRRFAIAGGIAFGAASFTNYLASFTGFSLLLWLATARRRQRYALPAATGMAPFILLDCGFFLAQRHSRSGQFAAFSAPHALALLAKDFGAAMFGGLPLYAGRAGLEVAIALLLLFLICAAGVIQRNHKHSALFALPAIATPCGLLALGLMFHNTPIEIRYLAFSTPFLALLFAASLPRNVVNTLLAVEVAAIIGLAAAPGTMQPQALAAQQAASFHVQNALVLVPFGNDGVGIPGPFIAATPPGTRLELIHPGATPNLADAPVIILATISGDEASRAATAQTLQWLHAQPCLTPGPATRLTEVFLNRCPDHQR